MTTTHRTTAMGVLLWVLAIGIPAGTDSAGNPELAASRQLVPG